MPVNKGGRPATARDAMLAQNYRVRREVCSECQHFLSHAEPAEWAVKLWPEEPERQKQHMIQRGKRCAIGGFSVKNTATCDLWTRHENPEGNLPA